MIADGVPYNLKKGDKFTYTNYLYFSDTDKVFSLDATTYFDKAGLKLIGPMDESEEDFDVDKMLPILKGDMVNEIDGGLTFNYSSAKKGKTFDKEDSELIVAEFEVTAESGVYEINTMIKTLAGDDEVVYVNKFEKLKDMPDAKSSGMKDVFGAEIAPWDGEVPTEAPTEPATGATTATTATTATSATTDTSATSASGTASGYTFTTKIDKWTLNGTTNAKFVVKNPAGQPANTDDITSVSVDGKAVDPSNYTLDKATGTVEIKASYLNTLSVGAHKLTVAFKDGTVETEFQVTKASSSTGTGTSGSGTSVKTGTTEMIIVFLMILAMAAGVVVYTKRKKD